MYPSWYTSFLTWKHGGTMWIPPKMKMAISLQLSVKAEGRDMLRIIARFRTTHCDSESCKPHWSANEYSILFRVKKFQIYLYIRKFSIQLSENVFVIDYCSFSSIGMWAYINIWKEDSWFLLPIAVTGIEKWPCSTPTVGQRDRISHGKQRKFL